ncbi:MAG TPA: RNA polymerase sigma factor [Polyangiaceae bacterium]|nr:RNA polymerase sigma factor [Polyangiaceae bacterium]
MASPLTETLVSAVDGDPSARLGSLIRKQFGFVWRLSRRIGLFESEVDSAVREVFEAAAQRIGDIRSGNERAFLFSTTLHVAARVRRNRGEQTASVERARTLGDLDEAGRARQTLGTLLERMPLELRVVFVLREIEQFSSIEIAEIIGIPLSTVTSRLTEAQADFASHLESESEVSLIAAARDERAPGAALLRALRAAGVEPTPSERELELDSSSASSRESTLAGVAAPRRSGWALAATWLAVGWVVGLVVVSAVWALSDAATTSATPASSTR